MSGGAPLRGAEREPGAMQAPTPQQLRGLALLLLLILLVTAWRLWRLG